MLVKHTALLVKLTYQGASATLYLIFSYYSCYLLYVTPVVYRSYTNDRIVKFLLCDCNPDTLSR
jgi:hypothetical protein